MQGARWEHAAEESAQVSNDDMALLDLKVQRDQLVGHRRRVEQQVAKDKEAARSFICDGKKQQAMLALRKKKLHDQLVLDCGANLAKVEELVEQIEVARTQKDVVEALAAGVATLRRVQQEIGGADYVHRLMDERDDALAEMQEMSEALAGAGVAADDAEALAELARLEEAHAAGVLQPAAQQATGGDGAATVPSAAPAAPSGFSPMGVAAPQLA
jgi:charged multivesicular body protein 6